MCNQEKQFIKVKDWFGEEEVCPQTKVVPRCIQEQGYYGSCDALYRILNPIPSIPEKIMYCAKKRLADERIFTFQEIFVYVSHYINNAEYRKCLNCDCLPGGEKVSYLDFIENNEASDMKLRESLIAFLTIERKKVGLSTCQKEG